jgi:hypothetical protein
VTTLEEGLAELPRRFWAPSELCGNFCYCIAAFPVWILLENGEVCVCAWVCMYECVWCVGGVHRSSRV